MTRPLPYLIDLAAGRHADLGTAAPRDVVASAIEHRMDGLLHSEARAGRIVLPDAEAAELATRDLYRQRRAASYWVAHDRLTAAAAAVGTEVATLKGATAELRWYERVGERPSVDLDAWIRPGPPEWALDLVAALDPHHPLLSADLVGLITTGRLQSLEVVVGDVTVDLHLDVLKLGVPSRIEEAMWARTMSFDVGGGRTARVLDSPAALLHLLVHLNKDRFRQLLGLADIARLLQRDQPDLADLEHLAREGGLEVPVLESLRAVVDELGLDAPRPVSPGGLRSAVWRFAWRPDIRLRGLPGVTGLRHRQALLPALLRGPGRSRDALRRYRRVAFPAPDLVRYRNADVPGGYARKLVVGRYRRWRESRSAPA